jgi:hypothetical protein
MRTATKPRAEQGRGHTPSARPRPPIAQPARPRRKARPRRIPLLPMAIIAAVLTSHMTAVAMLNYEHARQASLTREIDRTQLNIDRLRGQIAAHTDEIALRRVGGAGRAWCVSTSSLDLTMVRIGRAPDAAVQACGDGQR